MRRDRKGDRCGIVADYDNHGEEKHWEENSKMIVLKLWMIKIILMNLDLNSKIFSNMTSQVFWVVILLLLFFIWTRQPRLLCFTLSERCITDFWNLSCMCLKVQEILWDWVCPHHLWEALPIWTLQIAVVSGACKEHTIHWWAIYF